MSLVQQRSGHWLAIQVEAAKIALSESDQTSLDLGRIAPGEAFALDRLSFDASISRLVSTVERTVQNLLRDAGVSAASIDTVFFTGGSSSVPLLRERISALLPGSKRLEGDLFGSIGAGLALDAKREFS